MNTMVDRETVAEVEDQEAEDASVPTPDDDTDDTEATTEEPAPEGSADDTGDEDDADARALLGDAEYDKVKDDPKRLAKSLRRAYTQSTQRLSDAHKLLNELRTNPKAVLEAYAAQNGLSLAEAKKDESIADGLTEAFGPEIAKQLLPVFEGMIQKMVDQRVAPIKQTQDQQLQETAIRQSVAALEGLAAKHPDWAKYEKRMAEIGETLRPNGMDENVYLEHLYTLAKSDAKVGSEVRETVDRMRRSAGKAATSGKGNGVGESRVAPSPVKTPSTKEAWEAAKRGQRFED